MRKLPFAVTLAILILMSASAAMQEVELEFWFGHDRTNAFAQRFARKIEEFNETNPHGIRINMHFMGTSGYRDKLIAAEAAGTGPDVAHMWTYHLQPFAVSGLLLDVYSVIDPSRVRERADLTPGAAEMVTYKGGLYGLPLAANTFGLIYNGDDFNEAGLAGAPRTVEELDLYAQRLTRMNNDGSIAHMGYYPDDFTRLYWGWVFGGEYYDPETQRYTVDSPGIVAALEWNVSYHDRYGLGAIEAFRSALGSPAQGSGPLLSGLFSILSIGQYRIQTLRQLGPDTNWGFAPLPSTQGGPEKTTLIEADVAAVMASTSHPQEASEFLLWLGSSEVLGSMLGGEQNPLVPHNGVTKELYHPDYHMWLELAQSPNARAVPFTPIADSFATVFNAQVRKALNGQTTPRAALSEANSILNELMELALQDQP